MFKKNTAVTGFAVGLISATDNSDITTGTPVGYYTLDGGSQTAIGDTAPVHEGNGLWTFDLLAAEMNGDIVALTFTHTSAITVHITIKTSVLTTDDTLASDVISISGDSTAADNLELMYDGTGYIAETAPASRSQVDGIGAASGGAFALEVAEDNESSAIKGVSSVGTETGTFANTEAEDGTYHVIAHATNDIDWIYGFDIGGARTGISVNFKGYLNSGNDDMFLQAFDFVGSDWETIANLPGQNGSANITLDPALLLKHTGTGADIGKVYLRFEADGVMTSPSLNVDLLHVAAANIGRSIGYANGQIWLDTNNGVAGTEPFVNGVADNPSLTLAEVLTLSASVGLTDIHLINGSSITLTANSDNFSLFGDNWNLALGGQSTAGGYFQGAHVSGVGVSALEVHYEGCDIATMSVQLGHFDFCSFEGTVTHTLAGDYNYHNCYSKVAGAGSPIFTKTAGQVVTVQFRNWSGGITLSGLQASDVITVSGQLGTVTLNGADATVEIRGSYKNIVNNLTGSPTVNLDGAFLAGDIASTLADTGTDGVLLAATATSAQLVDDVWDEVLTGATHNVTDSAGKRIRDLQEFGSYEGGAIFIDTVNGAAGTTDYESGTMLNPVDTIADANTLAASLGLSRFDVAPSSNITFAANQISQVFSGIGWVLALGGQDISDSEIIGAQSVTGIATTPTGEVHFVDCELISGTLGQSHFKFCGFSGTLILSAVANYTMSDCYSQIPGNPTPVIDFGAAVGSTGLSMRRYSGGVEIQNYGATGTDTMSLEGNGQLIINANCVGGTIYVRGNFKVTNNSSGAVTIVYDDNTTNIAAIAADTNDLQARTPTAAQLAYMTAHAATAKPVTFSGGTTITAILANVDGSAASSTNDVYNSRLLVFNAGTLDEQVCQITDYDGSTKTATISAVTTAVTSSHAAILV